MSLNIRPLSKELAEKAIKELNEVPSRLPDDVQAFRDWIVKQPHLRARTDDQFLVNFLRGSKHSLERAKEKLELYYSVRQSMKDIWSCEDPMSPRNLELLRLGHMLKLPKTATPDGPVILLLRYSEDSSKYTFKEMMRIQFFLMTILMYDDDNVIIAGQSGLMDMKNASMAQFAQMSPALMKKMALLSQDASPMRMKSFNYLHMPSVFETMFNLFKSFLNEKIRGRVRKSFNNYCVGGFDWFLSFQLHIHSDLASLYKELPQHLLPVEYGGENGSIEELVKYWEDKLAEYRDMLIDEGQYGTDESRRQSPTKHSETLFGAEGSFRKLEVD